MPHRLYDIALVQMRQAPIVHGFDDQGSTSRPASFRGQGITVYGLARAVNVEITDGKDATRGAEGQRHAPAILGVQDRSSGMPTPSTPIQIAPDAGAQLASSEKNRTQDRACAKRNAPRNNAKLE